MILPILVMILATLVKTIHKNKGFLIEIFSANLVNDRTSFSETSIAFECLQFAVRHLTAAIVIAAHIRSTGFLR